MKLKTIHKQLGAHGLLGIMLLACAGVFYNLWLHPLEREVALLNDRLDTPRVKSKTSVQPSTPLTLPSDSEALDILAQIYMLAEATGVRYQQADYHLEASAKLENGAQREYRVNFPAEGAYKNLRYFIARVLAEQPSVSLDQISFKRDEISDPLLQADIRLTIFLRQ